MEAKLRSSSAEGVPRIFDSRTCRVLALVAGRAVQAQLEVALRPVATLSWFGSCEELCSALPTYEPCIVLVTPTDSRGVPTLATALELVRSSERTTLIGLVSRLNRWGDETLSLVRIAHEILVLEDLGFERGTRKVLANARRRASVDWAWGRIRLSIDPRLAHFVRVALVEGCARVRLDTICASLGLHRKTLWKYCSAQGMPPPHELIGWCRLFNAFLAMDDSRRTADSIALDLDFASPSALRNLVQRYLSKSPSEVRRIGGSKFVLNRFLQRIERFDALDGKLSGLTSWTDKV